jgi:hypothetical protein
MGHYLFNDHPLHRRITKHLKEHWPQVKLTALEAHPDPEEYRDYTLYLKFKDIRNEADECLGCSVGITTLVADSEDLESVLDGFVEDVYFDFKRK